MGFWLNHFFQFGRKQKSENPVVIGLQKVGGDDDVTEFYLPVEDWIFPLSSFLHQESGFGEAREEFRKDETLNLAFVQFVKALMKDPLADYALAKKYEGNRDSSSEPSIKKEGYSAEDIEALARAYRTLEKGFFSIKPEFDSKKCKLLKPSQENLALLRKRFWGNEEDKMLPQMFRSFKIDPMEINENFLMFFLIREHQAELRVGLTPAKRADLTRIVNGFNEFLGIGSRMVGGVNAAYFLSQEYLAEKAGRRFYAKYGFNLEDLDYELARGYEELARELRESGAKFLEAKGDYIFVSGMQGKTLKSAIKVRELAKYRVGAKPKTCEAGKESREE